MKVIWHNTKHIHSRVLEVQPPHALGAWEVYAPGWKGLGAVTVAVGPAPKPPPEIMAICRVKNVWRVISDPDGFFIITVSNDRFWAVTEGEVTQAYAVARGKEDAGKAGTDQREDGGTPTV